MRLFVPDIGSSLWLEENWNFPLYDEWRNEKFLAVVVPDFKEHRTNEKWKTPGGGHYGWYGKLNHSITIPAGTELIVARVYIRNGAENYSSLTFRIGHCEHKTWRKKRFWAKLQDCNRIEFEATV